MMLNTRDNAKCLQRQASIECVLAPYKIIALSPSTPNHPILCIFQRCNDDVVATKVAGVDAPLGMDVTAPLVFTVTVVNRSRRLAF